MKYAIRVSHLPPCVIYATIEGEPPEVLAWMNEEIHLTNGVFKLVTNILRTLEDDIMASSVYMLEDENRVVFTDTRDVDILITRVPTGWEMHVCQ
jgi:hypothetical protein